MPAQVIDGKSLAGRIRAQVAEDVAAFGDPVCLATVLVGDDPASHIYVGAKHKASHEAGILSRDHRLPEATDESEVLDLVADLNADEGVDGILVQLPLPAHMDEPKVTGSIDPSKDVDGLHPFNAGSLFLGRPLLVPATPSGIMRMLAEYEIGLVGKRAVVIGRSEIVGKPIAMLLLAEHATVTMCHSRTADIGSITREADVLVVAVGRPGFVTADMVRPGSAVVDVGVNRTDDGIVGDVDKGVAEVAGYITPVPGHVGPMTIAMLLENTLRAARLRRSLV